MRFRNSMKALLAVISLAAVIQSYSQTAFAEYNTGWYQIDSDYKDGIALHPQPYKESAILTRLPDQSLFLVELAMDSYGYTKYDGYEGWINLSYAVPKEGYSVGTYKVAYHYEPGIALRTTPSDQSDLVIRIPMGEQFEVDRIEGVYGYAQYKEFSGWINLKYCTPAVEEETEGLPDWLTDPTPEQTESQQTEPQQTEPKKNAAVTEDQAYAAVRAYCEETYDMDQVYRNHGFLVLGEEEADYFVVWFRSYTGAHIYYDVEKESGDVYISAENPIEHTYSPLSYGFSAYDYL